MKKTLPMRGRRNATKRIKLAASIDRPEYFQREINALTKTQPENNDAQDSHEEDSQEVVARQESSPKAKGKSKRGKSIQGKGLLD